MNPLTLILLLATLPGTKTKAQEYNAVMELLPFFPKLRLVFSNIAEVVSVKFNGVYVLIKNK